MVCGVARYMCLDVVWYGVIGLLGCLPFSSGCYLPPSIYGKLWSTILEKYL